MESARYPAARVTPRITLQQMARPLPHATVLDELDGIRKQIAVYDDNCVQGFSIIP